MLVDLAGFVVAVVLIMLLPGPDTLVVIRSLVQSGRAGAIRTVAGVMSGLAIWVVTAVLGLSAVLQASHDAYLVLRLAGAVYLSYLGTRSLLASRRGAGPKAEPRGDGSGSSDGWAGDRLVKPRTGGILGTGYLAGLLTDLLNPKVGVFFVAFLPGFVPPHYPLGWTSLFLGGVFLALSAIYYAALLIASGPITSWVQSQRVRPWMDRLTGVVLVGFGIRLLSES